MRFALVFMAITWKVFAQSNPVVDQVQAAAQMKDYTTAERMVHAMQSYGGVTPASILAISWISRGALANRDFDRAEKYAAETRNEALEQLKRRPVDAEPDLPLALGASIEVTAQALAARGRRSEAVGFLQQEIKTWRGTSMALRLQKNLNLLTLEGKPAPALDMTHYVGQPPVPLAGLHGHVVLLFFWAHWCGDCKVEASMLQQINANYGPKGLVLIGPTQHYGYAANGADAPPTVETKWIEENRIKYDGRVGPMSVPVSEKNFLTYGASSMPTFVLIDKAGIVQLYYPGKMTYEELAPRIAKLLGKNG
jgi:thiol-disulfide isomerase/thioredoxin